MIEVKISVIVPCYNVEKYLQKCVDSILNQTYRNLEVILVDDGSTDSTPMMCDEYMEKDERVKVLHKENGGVSMARNLGIDTSVGKWIMFIDSDDWFEDEAFTHIAKYIERDDAEVIGFNHYYNSETKQAKRGGLKIPFLKRSGIEIEYFMGDTMFPYFDYKKNNMTVGAIRGVWGKVFKSSIIKNNNIRFLENLKIAEDAIFCLDVFKVSSTVILHNDYLIHYRLHSGSVMNQFSKDVIRINDISLQEYFKRKVYFKNKELFDICFLGMVSECLFRTFKLYLSRKECGLSFRQKICILKSMLASDVYMQAFECNNDNYLPAGKKQMIYAARKRHYRLLYVIASLCVEIKNKL